jgi:hypothetical protein
MPPYNPTSVYVPSPSETDKEARDMSIKRNLTVTNVSAQTLGVLGDLTTGGSLAANGTLTVPVVRYNGDPAPASAPSAGLIKIDQTATSGRLYFSRLDATTAAQSATDLNAANAAKTVADNAEAGNVSAQLVSTSGNDDTDVAAVRAAAGASAEIQTKIQEIIDAGGGTLGSAQTASQLETDTRIGEKNSTADTSLDSAEKAARTFQWIAIN